MITAVVIVSVPRGGENASDRRGTINWGDETEQEMEQIMFFL